MVLDYMFIYIYIYIYIYREICRTFIATFFIGGEIAMRKPAVVLSRGGISSMEYHLFLDLSRCRSITPEKRTQKPKAARKEQVGQKNKRARAISDQKCSGH